MLVYCQQCNKEFKTSTSSIKRGRGKFCCRKCYYNSIKGENHFRWKGDKVSRRQLHTWIEREKGTPNTCEHCKRTNIRCTWANISGKYKRDVNDFIRLCYLCHNKYDYEDWYKKLQIYLNNKKK